MFFQFLQNMYLAFEDSAITAKCFILFHNQYVNYLHVIRLEYGENF
jgi:hypothetical protein